MAGFHLDDTIAAVSTAMAPAGIGIVRISGNDAFEVADRVFRAKKKEKAFCGQIPYDSLWMDYRRGGSD